ncbi:hypothetical protein DN752_12325 [Echinicola strongylocentroti]|uniref:Uncharacterized protein n=1 Tax=Echinicola strongylocentroti TaxID=1795355 RepID=A0A2Z4IJC6_9BACT|nr:hypothetical protein [Echinicola strongylocentroti]AWW30849.1 hypothetical protein DN752_12325 [Echinicola strongylocentroti]
MTSSIHDPAIELSQIIVRVLQVAAALFGGLFLWLSIMAFNGHAMVNMLLEMVDEPVKVHAGEMLLAGVVFLVLFVACVAAFFVLRYLREVVNSEVATFTPKSPS